MRRPLVIGNWKMNGTLASGTELVNSILAGMKAIEADLAVCAPYVYLSELNKVLAGTSLGLGSQNIADQVSGAYTGEVSASMLKEMNCSYALVGHSERRSYYGDTNESVAARYCQALEQDIIPVLCVGETLEEREQGITFKVIDEQLDAVIEKAGIESFAKSVVAYEPVWAIGTGKTATDDQAQEVHQYIRQRFAAQNAEIAENLQILYGGSCKPNNAQALFAMPDIDGGLIGGASLEAESFLAIYNSTQSS